MDRIRNTASLNITGTGTACLPETGLTKPMSMSAELATIVGADEGEKMARSEIIKRLWAYLKKNNLQVPLNFVRLYFRLKQGHGYHVTF